MYGIIVHGGAWDIPDDIVENHVNGCRKAVQVGFKYLESGMSALDAVENAVRIMEDDPTFDAGRGAFLNRDGEIELDAVIMDGRNLDAGSVAAVKNIRNPVSLARNVMEKTEHVLLAGEGANKFASSIGINTCPEEELLVGRELERWKALRGKREFKTHEVFDKACRDTVGACSVDLNGNVAAATSTGGTPKKLPGRVGDSPLVGCGAYADNEAGAVSTTGWGESIIKVVLAKTALDRLRETGSPLPAAKKAISILESRVNGLGGVIIVDRNGEFGLAHNTPRMAFAYKNSGSGLICGIDSTFVKL